MQTMGMVEVEQFRNLPNVSGIIWTGYNGRVQGEAMAKISLRRCKSVENSTLRGINPSAICLI